MQLSWPAMVFQALAHNRKAQAALTGTHKEKTVGPQAPEARLARAELVGLEVVLRTQATLRDTPAQAAGKQVMPGQSWTLARTPAARAQATLIVPQTSGAILNRLPLAIARRRARRGCANHVRPWRNARNTRLVALACAGATELGIAIPAKHTTMVLPSRQTAHGARQMALPALCYPVLPRRTATPTMLTLDANLGASAG